MPIAPVMPVGPVGPVMPVAPVPPMDPLLRLPSQLKQLCRYIVVYSPFYIF
ncbi:hypothetical protein [Bacillus sp. NP247]|uniref:hypothetical protein n=1 Tax=Bacillus sp. NP247 TaxID=2846779 RepID=UPI001C62AFC2|nr:hypothetical protein [Bacillus sp. NP247]QWU47338.1 hypothetical protein KPL75_10485 [Bacillus sp. NP247]